MRDFDVRQILVDPGSSTDLLQASVINQMGLKLSGLENLGGSYRDSMERKPPPLKTLCYQSKQA